MTNKTEQLAVKVDRELRERLERAAERDQRPLAGLIRKILNEALPAKGEAA